MGTLTTHFQFQKPTVGADDDVWGNDFSTGNPAADPSPGLNGNWSKADLLLKQQADAIAALTQALGELEAKALVPIGGLYTSTTDTDPASTLGYGTWAAWGAGRALVGVGDNGDSTWSAGEERGSEAHTLTVDELPTHSHDLTNVTVEEAGGHTHITRIGKVGKGGDSSNVLSTDFAPNGVADIPSETAGAHTHNVSGSVGDTGTDRPHNNIQPSKAAYIWVRTA